MTWKKLNNSQFGTADVFGGGDIDKISKLFDGTGDVDNVDINSNTTIRADKFKFRDPTNSFSYTITPSAITADRVLTLPLLPESSHTFLFENATQDVTNKTLLNNIFEGPTTGVSGFVGDPALMRWGAVFPVNAAETAAGVAAREGMLSGHTIRNPNGNPIVEWSDLTADGYEGETIRLQNTTSSGEYCGLISPTGGGTGILRMSHDGRIKVRWAQDDNTKAAFLCGLHSSSASPLNATTPMATTASGILMGNTPADTDSYRMWVHNGDGTAPVDLHVVGPPNVALGLGEFRDLEIWWYHDGTGLHAKMTMNASDVPDLAPYRIEHAANLPAESTNLYFHCQLINTTTSAERFNLASIWIESL